MSDSLAEEGIPLKVVPFSAPKSYNPGNELSEDKGNHRQKVVIEE